MVKRERDVYVHAECDRSEIESTDHSTHYRNSVTAPPSSMPSSSPGYGVLPPLSSSSPRHGHSNEPSFAPPSPPLTFLSLSSPIQRLVDLLILTPPSTSTYQHLATALSHAITAATPTVIPPSLPFISHPAPRRIPHFTTRILTPILPLSLLPSSAPAQSSSSGAKDIYRQPTPIPFAYVSSLTARSATPTRAKKQSWAEMCSSPSPSSPSFPSSPSSLPPAIAPLSPSSPSHSVASKAVALEASCRPILLHHEASMPLTSSVQGEPSEMEEVGETSPHCPLPSPIPSSAPPSPSASPPPIAAAAVTPTPFVVAWTRSKTKRIRSAIRKLLTTLDPNKSCMLTVFQHLVDLHLLEGPTRSLPQCTKQPIRQYVEEELLKLKVAAEKKVE